MAKKEKLEEVDVTLNFLKVAQIMSSELIISK